MKLATYLASLTAASAADADTFTFLKAGSLVKITKAELLSAVVQALAGKQDTLTAGTNITIADGVISATGGGSGSSAWGGITGTIASQTDLVSYVAARIAELVDSSPASLNTLKEFATALADDPNFATTITNALAAKAAKTQAIGLMAFIETPENKAYTLVLKAPYPFTITEVVTKTASGTCTVTGAIDGVSLGGAANSASSTEQTQTKSTANSVAAGQDVAITVSANASAADLRVAVNGTRVLA